MTLSARLHDEASELSDKIMKLNSFINTGEIFLTLDEFDQELLVSQLDIMKAYKAILMKRTIKFK